METKTFQLHVDASLLDFKFKDPSYVTVAYGCILGEIILYEIIMPAHVLKVLNNSGELYKQAEAAAKHNSITMSKAA